MKKILISECLCGDRAVRYDGRIIPQNDPVILKWKDEGRLVRVCPEVFGGLPVPRTDSQRSGGRVIMRGGRDVTAEYVRGAEEALRLAAENDIVFALMKQNSPSCGSLMIHDGTFSGNKVPGQGVAVEYLRNAGYTVFGEDQIKEAEEYLVSAEK